MVGVCTWINKPSVESELYFLTSPVSHTLFMVWHFLSSHNRNSAGPTAYLFLS